MSNLSGYEVQVGFQSQHITVCICTLNLFKASIWWCLKPAAQFRPDSWPRTFAGVPPYDELTQRLIWSITLLYKLAPQPPFCSATYVRPTIRSQFCETFPHVPHYPHWVKPSTFLGLLASHAVCFFRSCLSSLLSLIGPRLLLLVTVWKTKLGWWESASYWRICKSRWSKKMLPCRCKFKLSS